MWKEAKDNVPQEKYRSLMYVYQLPNKKFTPIASSNKVGGGTGLLRSSSTTLVGIATYPAFFWAAISSSSNSSSESSKSKPWGHKRDQISFGFQFRFLHVFLNAAERVAEDERGPSGPEFPVRIADPGGGEEQGERSRVLGVEIRVKARAFRDGGGDWVIRGGGEEEEGLAGAGGGGDGKESQS
nr:hypothetical protein Iba_chr02dCG0520 [Ipomoea batatas]